MIFVDTSNTLYSTLCKSLGEGSSQQVAKQMVFVTLLSYKKKFGQKYGAPVLAFDTQHGEYWRKEIFPHYKYGRDKSRSTSKVDWSIVKDLADEVTEGLIANVPWKTVRVKRAEADDIIGVLTMKYGASPTLIMASDKDYKQLHGLPGVMQYSSVMKKWITTNNPLESLYELILEGDTGDGIPNLLSPLTSFVDGKRQSPITPKRRKEFFDDIEGAKEKHKERFEMNQRLVDFNFIPDDVRADILTAFDAPIQGNINKLYKYFVTNRMSGLVSDIELFKTGKDDYAICSESSFFG